MRSTQLSESLNSDLKDHLKSALDILRFFKHVERVVQGKRGHYILKRWTREARSGTIQNSHGNIVLEDPRSEDRQQLKFFMHDFHGIASQAVASKECIKLVDDALRILRKQVEEKAPTTTCTTEDIYKEPEDCLQAACLKKKEIPKKNSRRERNHGLTTSTPIKRRRRQ
uniref:Protein FAR1-RELATED SEQUENCE n=1 Tax=Aegilops tauschii subsp. strangulata TaxID=200361 RepID=A0A453TA10_AEGTS